VRPVGGCDFQPDSWRIAMSKLNDCGGCVSEAFYDSYVLKLVRRRAKRLAEKCGKPDEWEDFRQDMFVEILTAAGKYEPELASEHTYVDRVLKNFSKTFLRNHYRARRKGPEIFPLDDPSIQTDGGFVLSGVDSETLKIKRDRFERLWSLLENLPGKLRRTCCALMENSNKRQVARELNISNATLYIHIERSRTIFIKTGFDVSKICVKKSAKSRKKAGRFFQNGICNKWGEN
jgi:RNA polymerase sigma factor (sigma-70 family)